MTSLAAVIDNDALVNLYELNKKDKTVLFQLRVLFQRIHIPLEVKNEFIEYKGKDQIERINFIQNFTIDSGFIRLCNQFDVFNTTFLTTMKGIDKGEREVIAQKLKISAFWIISDDYKFTKALQEYSNQFTIINSLHVLAMIELNQLHHDCNSLKNVLKNVRPFNKTQFREACQFAAKHIGINLPNKKLRVMLDY